MFIFFSLFKSIGLNSNLFMLFTDGASPYYRIAVRIKTSSLELQICQVMSNRLLCWRPACVDSGNWSILLPIVVFWDSEQRFFFPLNIPKEKKKIGLETLRLSTESFTCKTCALSLIYGPCSPTQSTFKCGGFFVFVFWRGGMGEFLSTLT